jgi:hypothetical protein
MLYDPELVGAALRRIVGSPDPADDYQDLPLWFPLVAETARLLRLTYRPTLVVPMTVWRRDRADALAEGPDTRRWCLRHLDAGLALMADPAFGDEIATAGRTPDEVADDIAARLGTAR